MSVCEATTLDPREEHKHEAVQCTLPAGHVGSHSGSVPQTPHPPMQVLWRSEPVSDSRVTIGGLPEKWRAEAKGEPDAGYQCAMENCADELEQAMAHTGASIVAAFKAVGDAL